MVDFEVELRWRVSKRDDGDAGTGPQTEPELHFTPLFQVAMAKRWRLRV